MGTDIHMVVERFDGKAWQPVRFNERPCVPTCPKNETCWRCWGRGRVSDPIYDGRSYSLFAVLAGIRSGSGFAGTPTGDPIPPISEPRGIPEDFASDRGDIGEYGFSWLTLAELQAFDWSQPVKRDGWVRPDQFKVFRETGRPNGWCAWAAGGETTHVSNTEMARLIMQGKATDRTFTTVEWLSPLIPPDHEWMRALERLEALAEGKPEHVRIVFGFDS